MQATLSARNKILDAVAPRTNANRLADRGSDRADAASNRRDDFAGRLADARDRTARDANGADPSKPTPDAKTVADDSRVERSKPRDDAGNADQRPAETIKAKSTRPGEDDVAVDDAAVEVAEVKTPIEPAKADDASADAMAAAMNAAKLQQPKGEPVPQKTDDTGANAVAAASTIAVATAVASTAEGLATGPDPETPGDATDSTQAAVAGKIAAVDPEAKSKLPVEAKGVSGDPKADQAVAGVAREAASSGHGSRDADAQQQQPQDDASASDGAANLPEAAASGKPKASAESTFDALLAKLAPQDAIAPKPAADHTLNPPAPVISAERKFAADNVDNVVKSVRTQMDAGGGQMRMRLDPPELGALEVAVKMIDGRMTASFTTSNEQATQLLSHSLNELKQSLEASGITVDRIQVRQSSSDNNAQQQPGDHRREGQSGAFDQSSSRGDQQRREAVEKMWRKLAYGSDELDFVA